MKKHGKLIAKYGENLSFGFEKPDEIVLQMVIDDGQKSRGHRENLFDEAFK